MRSNREYDYFGNVLEYEYDYFASYSSTSMSTPKVLVLEYEYTSTITPSLIGVQSFIFYDIFCLICVILLINDAHLII